MGYPSGPMSDPVIDLDRVVTRPQLARDLRALGVAPGEVLMVHESVKAIGWVAGGPDVVIDALLDAVGPTGTLMKYVGSEDGTYALAEWPAAVQAAYRDTIPGFDPATTRACRAWGILTEYLRTRPGAVRSAHPEGSFAALGARAAELVADHPLQDGLGPGSPLDKLVAMGGKVLLVGCPLAHTTLVHLAEYRARLPEKRRVRYESPVMRGGERVWVAIEELDSSDGIVDWTGTDYFELIVRAFLDAGLGRSGRVGHAEAHLMGAAALVEFAARWMEENLRGLPVTPTGA